jgi:mRNA interferase MazF
LTTDISPKRGEVWLVNFDPTVGAEIRKVRPAVVISSDTIGRLPIKLIAPITDWKAYYANNIWHVKVEPDNSNGLAKTSAVDALQLRGVDRQRFIRKLGQLSAVTMEEITIAIAAVTEYVEAPEKK